jgi:tyrosine decarboxylase/aspartate 1-decarboxylase
LWERGVTEDEIKRELAKAETEDSRFISGKILGSMCTEPLDIAKDAHYQFLEANLGNAGLYPGTKRLEEEVVQAMADMLQCRKATGSIVSGGTEANITSLWIARNKTGRKKVIFPKSAHFSFHKACDILALEPVVVPLTEKFTIDVDEVARVVDDDVCAIVGIAGTTELGTVDDIVGLAELLPDGAFLHVDAAFGGFVLPFLKKMGMAVPDFDFTIPEVTTLTVDPHKMGMATIPAGALLIRDEKWIDNIHKEAPYLSSVGQTAALSGTRCSAAVAATYAAMRFLGEEGYVELVGNCMETTQYALKRAEELGIEPVVNPLMNIVCFYVPDPKRVQHDLDELGWKVSVANSPECLRLVIMPHVTRDSISGLFSDLEGVLGGIS